MIDILLDRRKEMEDENLIRDLRTQIAGVEEKYNTLFRERIEAAEEQVAVDPWSSHLRWRPRKESVIKKEVK